MWELPSTHMSTLHRRLTCVDRFGRIEKRVAESLMPHNGMTLGDLNMEIGFKRTQIAGALQRLRTKGLAECVPWGPAGEWCWFLLDDEENK